MAVYLLSAEPVWYMLEANGRRTSYLIPYFQVFFFPADWCADKFEVLAGLRMWEREFLTWWLTPPKIRNRYEDGFRIRGD